MTCLSKRESSAKRRKVDLISLFISFINIYQEKQGAQNRSLRDSRDHGFLTGVRPVHCYFVSCNCEPAIYLYQEFIIESTLL